MSNLTIRSRIFSFAQRLKTQLGLFQKIASFVAISIAVLGSLMWRFRPWQQLPTKNTWIDILLGTFNLAVVPFAMAAYGGHVAAESIEDLERRRTVKLKFWAICLVGVGLAFVQQYRSVTQDAASKSKTGQVEGAILGQLQNLHEKGRTTSPEQAETKRREDIMSMLRGQYILQHDNLPSGILEGTAPLPSEWINKRLHDLGELWTVSKEPPRQGPSIAPRSYIAFSSSPQFPGHLGAEGSNFQAGQLLGFNVHFKASGPNSVQLLETAHSLVIEPDAKPETQRAAVAVFMGQVRKERNTFHLRPSTMMPADDDFFTAFARTDTNQLRVVSQDDLAKLKAGTEVVFMLAELTYKDTGAVHHLRRCMWLQPPASPPGIWQFCGLFNRSN